MCTRRITMQPRARRQRQLFEEPPAAPAVRLPLDVQEQLRQALLARPPTQTPSALPTRPPRTALLRPRPPEEAPRQPLSEHPPAAPAVRLPLDVQEQLRQALRPR